MNKKMPFVSIGISFYNAELTLLDAVRSVFAQNHQNWELILIDDGSTDNSLKLARSIKDPRVKVYSDGKNLKLAARLNQIARIAKYDFLARMDADDLMSPLRIEKQLDILLSQSHIDLVSTGLCSLTDDYEPVGVRYVPADHSITANKLLSGGAGIVHASLLGRREWFERNPYKENLVLGEDANLWIRSFSKNDLRVAFISDPLYYYKEDSSVTRSKLLTAYAIGRNNIIFDAKNRFSFIVRVRALIKNLGKTVFIKIFSKFGALELARNRRNVEALDKAIKNVIEDEISSIRNTNLPLD